VEADTAIVSPQRGTTTDVVRKSYEILDFAPVIFIDTAGIDDDSVLGDERIRRTLAAIGQIDLALLVFEEWGEPERGLAERFHKSSVPFIAVHNIISGENSAVLPQGADVVAVNAIGNDAAQRDRLLDAIKRALPESSYRTPKMFDGIASSGDMVLLICPIDSEAPAGRMILPQVQAIRELLDMHAIPVVVQPEEIARTVASGIDIRIAVTDSQMFAEARRALPDNIELTSFSVLLAAAKGDYTLYLKGLEKVDSLQDGDRILIAESCTHQVSCEDIGRVKIPKWLQEYTGRKLQFTTVSGLAPLPDDLNRYALMIQCGGCMVTRSQLQNRLRSASAAGLPVTNYGMLIRKLRLG
jgi:[FeFe] hydrogenase H-cluster maturation GTPase HydF